MISPARIAANRRNAARSSGPRTPKGKARSRRNAYKHGLAIPITNLAEFDGQISSLAKKLAAITGVRSEVTYAVAAARLRLIRAREVEIQIINRAVAASNAVEAILDDEARLGLAVATKAAQLAAIQRYAQRAFSLLNRLITQLETEKELDASSPGRTK